MLADLVIVPGNPLAQSEDCSTAPAICGSIPRRQRVERVGGVRWTIKDGMVYDARALLASVERMVAEARARDGAAGQ